jgi:DNA-binding NtrC family response regulator
VFESELFGHLKGSFTDAKSDRIGRFELADGGTLFMDEIANITTAQQAKLLRVVQTGELERVGSSKTRKVDVRVISATNADLRSEVSGGRFREDLLYRLNTIEIRLPPLRDRREDIPLLAALFLHRHSTRYRKGIGGFRPEAMQAMLGYSWPGNIRELDHSIERAVLLADQKEIQPADLSLAPPPDGAARLEALTLEEVERVLIQKAVARAGGSVTEAAKSLGLSRSALYRRLERYGL